MIGLFRNVVQCKSSVEYSIALRQLAVKNPRSKSSFIQVDGILSKYGLPSAHEILLNTPPKGTWKRTIKERIQSFWEAQNWAEAESKSSLRYMSSDTLGLSSKALVWRSATSSPRETEKAHTKAKLLCGVLYLNSYEATIMRGNGTCPLCKESIETREHFLLDCPTLEARRSTFRSRLVELLGSYALAELWNSREQALQLLVDPSHSRLGAISEDDHLILQVEAVSRDWVYFLYLEREANIKRSIGVLT